MTKPTYLLEIYDSDDVTLLFDVSSDPAHARPYLKVPDAFAEQEIDFAKSSASIGQVNVRIVDVRTVATDQDTGYVTSQLADADGYSQLGGHRAVLYEDRGSGNELVIDGVVRQVTLLETLVTYEVELRDIRERERKQRAFEHTNTPTIFPRGVLDGYGRGPEGEWLVPPVKDSPLTATYREGGNSNHGRFDFSGMWDQGSVIPDELVITDKQRAALESVAQNPDISTILFHLLYDRFTVLWRDTATGGAYTELTKIVHQSAFSVSLGAAPIRPYTAREGRIGATDGDRGDGLLSLGVDNLVSGDTLPTDGQAVDVIIRYDGPVDEDWPFHIEGLTVGEFLRNLYRGDYSTDEEGNTVDPRIRYDEAALLALTTPIRGRIREPWEDVRKQAEKHAYPVAGAAPALNTSGEIDPPTYELPDASVSLVTLDDSNCRAEAGWSHGVQDAVNVVKVTYQRDYRVTAADDPRGTRSAGDGLASKEITVEHRVRESIALLGEQELKVESDLLRAIGSRDGAPITGDVGDETGAQVAQRITRMATDRWVLGGQYFTRIANRNEALVEALKVGSWCLEATSWTPEYSTGTRGANRLAQVLGRRNLDANWAQLSLIDAGADNVPLGQPTLGTITADDEGIVSVPVDAVPSGGEARVDFAVVASGAAEPAEGSELWTFLGRTDSVGTLESPPLPADTRVWIRSRGEGHGRRPSAWTTGVSVSLAATPRVRDVRITIAADGTPTVHWTPNASAAGVRLHYEVHDPGAEPTLPNTVDVDASVGSHELSGETVGTTDAFSVDVEPFDGWTGSAVSGTAGPKVSASRGRSTGFDQEPPAPIITFTQGRPRTQKLKIQAEAGASGDDPAEYRYKVDDEDGEVSAWSSWTALTDAGGGTWESSEIAVDRGWRVARYVRAQVRDTSNRESDVAERTIPSLKQWLNDLHGGRIGSWERDEEDVIGGVTRDDSGQSVQAPPGGVLDDSGLEQILDTEGRRLRNSALEGTVTVETSGRGVDTVDDEAHDARRHGPGMGSTGPMEESVHEGETRDDSGVPIMTRPGGIYDRDALVRQITEDGQVDALTYPGGVAVQDREPQEAGANVTENRTSADTSAVDGEPAANIHDGSDKARAAINDDNRLQTALEPDAGVAEGGSVHRIYRNREEITVEGPDADGDVAVTFAQSYQAAPLLIFQGGQYISFHNSLTGTQKLRIRPVNVSASGFTSRTKILNPGATTAESDDFPSGNLLNAQGETTAANLDPGGANDDNYTVHYYVEITADEANSGTLNSAEIVVAIETNDGGGWVERATFNYSVTSDDLGPQTKTWDHEQKLITVTGLGLNDDIRLRVKSFTVDQTGSFKVRGGDGSGSNPETYNGVTYTTASETDESAIPDAGDSALWVAQEVA